MGIAQKLVRNALWQVLSFLPKDSKKVVCQSYYGRGYSDSPKALAEELRRRGWKVYWTVKSQEDALSLPEDVIPLVIDSPKAIWHLCTAGAWVDNSRKWAYTQKRGATRYVQTWHGFPLKRIEGDAAGALDESYVIAAKKDSAMCDLFLSNSVFLTEAASPGTICSLSRTGRQRTRCAGLSAWQRESGWPCTRPPSGGIRAYRSTIWITAG